MQFYILLALVFALLVAIFALQNASPVGVQFFFWKLDISLVLIILGSAVLGAVTMFLLGLARERRQAWEISQLRQEIQTLKKEHVPETPPPPGVEGEE